MDIDDIGRTNTDLYEALLPPGYAAVLVQACADPQPPPVGVVVGEVEVLEVLEVVLVVLVVVWVLLDTGGVSLPTGQDSERAVVIKSEPA